ncbi:sulfatase [Pontiella agarivorans]|uniref:Sulfatase n=1 Tax=Pontiella agarivorans TaxID=3038953 RepID=A0ABU5N0R0_9BACT|nr:sulfatase [Pontiella agarivorans]MDZ8120040.1 sulfatase [Pontiella agarivorans]
MKKKILYSAILSLLGLSAVQADNPPNIIFILTDDMGWSHTSVPMIEGRPDTGSQIIQTPQLERLAQMGMTFSDGYAPGPICSVSRFSLLYGRTPARLMRTTNRAQLKRRPDLTQFQSIPRVLKAVNPSYRTGHFGKWHMNSGGIDRTHTPARAGFDVEDGPNGNGTGNNKGKSTTVEDPKFVFALTQKAIDFMQTEYEAGHPFYLQLSHYANHSRNEARQETLDKHKALPDDPIHGNDLYNAMAEDLDCSIGMLLDAIEEMGVADNTYIFYLSDNGGSLGIKNNLNAPLRGGKSQIWDGGVRVPFFVAGPGVAGGTYSRTPVSGVDLLPTFADLAGSTENLEPDLDGVSLRPLLESNGQLVLERSSPLVFHYPHAGNFSTRPWSAIRQGQWKLVHYWDGDEESLLFNIEEGIEETEDQSKTYPEKTELLKRSLIQYLESVHAEQPEESWTWGVEMKKKGWQSGKVKSSF